MSKQKEKGAKYASAMRCNFQQRACWAWVRFNHPEVFERIEQEAAKRYPRIRPVSGTVINILKEIGL